MAKNLICFNLIGALKLNYENYTLLKGNSQKFKQ